jgi:menaquinone-dependent protoporphyrinogen oxidase
MSTLVVYASKHGATEGIAERIAETLRAAGCQAEARSVQAAGDLTGYDAFVIGSALYMFHWMKAATKFVRRNRAVLASRPLWLFSSGPVGTETTDKEGRDLRAVSGPKELPELLQALDPRDHHVFYGAADRSKLGRGLVERMSAKWLPEGDFRDWQEVDAWAAAIADELAQARPGSD